MIEQAPAVSVIVPVRDREDLLLEILDALSEQTYQDFEVIVVDDGSVDGSGDLAATREIVGRRVRTLKRGGDGAVAARTAGVSASCGAFLAFTDSDCVPEPQWLAAGVVALENGADLVNGPTRPARSARPLERTMGSAKEGLYPTCNVFYRREVFERAGGFDADIGKSFGFRINRRARGLGFGEDTLLAWRVIRAGGRAAYIDDAVVRHHVFRADFIEALNRSWMMAAFPALVREVPELRGTLLRRGIFIGRRNRLPIYATLIAALRRRRLLLAATLVWWTLVRANDLRRTPARWYQKLAMLPIEMLLDCVTAVALIVGSTRTRTAVL